MSATSIKTAMILAAGLGTRMRAAATDPPKPLVEIGGQTLLARLLDRLETAGIEKIVINLHHKAEQIEAHIADRHNRAEIIFSDERDGLLDTGGGVKKALAELGEAPFLVSNADILWREAGDNITALLQAFDAETMDVLLLLADTETSTGYDGAGDYIADADGHLRRRQNDQHGLIFSGLRVVSPAVFDTTPEGAFSFNEVFDQAEHRRRLFGIKLDGQWMHVGTPEGRAAAQALINASS